MKYTEEELNKVLEEAPKDEKGRPTISDEDFLDNLKLLPKGIRSVTGKLSGNSGYVQLMEKGSQKAKEIASMGGKASNEMYQKRKTMAETIDIYLKKTDENGVSNQDKIVLAMIAKANDGCVGAFEALRDTVGEKPSDQVSLDVMTDGDKQLMEILKKRLGYDGSGSTEKQ
jgi:hypothetical protein